MLSFVELRQHRHSRPIQGTGSLVRHQSLPKSTTGSKLSVRVAKEGLDIGSAEALGVPLGVQVDFSRSKKGVRI